MEDPLVSIVIPVGPDCDSLGQSLDRVMHQDFPKKEVIVVCDPRSPCADTVPKGSEELRVMRLKQPRSPGELINDGMRAARGHVKVLLRPYCTPIGAGWLSSLVAPFENDDVGAVVSQCVAAPECAAGLPARLLDSADPPLRRNTEGRPVPQATVSHLCDAYRASLLADVGYFQVDGLRSPGDAIDMSIKLADAGYSILLSDQAVVSYHAPAERTRLRGAMARALDYGSADAVLDKLYDLHWLNAGVLAAALLSLTLLPLALLSLPLAVAVSLLMLVWGAFLTLRLPVLGWECPVLILNVATYVGIMMLVRDEWAPGVFGRTIHPAILRQWCWLAALTASYGVLVGRVALRGAVRAARRPGGLRYAVPILFLGAAWWLLAGVGFVQGRFPGLRGGA